MKFFSAETEHASMENLQLDEAQTISSAPQKLLTPENCTSSSRIRAFLRLSRIASDDSIRQHLNEISLSQCDSYFNKNILPQWRARSDAIQFCSGYAKGLRAQAEAKETTISSDVDLRIDPYTLKNAQEFLDDQYAVCVSVENWVANETNVENIIRGQTASILSDKCYYKDWLSAFNVASRR